MDVTTKDYRTWVATVAAVEALQQFGAFKTKTEAKANVAEAIRQVSARLENTPAICRTASPSVEVPAEAA
jgi:DNA topoisomerase-1